MIHELPPGPESEAIIRDDANRYAQSVIDDSNWLRNLPPDETTNALFMVFAHADQDLFDQAFDNICAYMDKMEDQQSERK